MAVEKFHVHGVSVKRTAPLEFVGTLACEGGKTIQIVFTAHQAMLFVHEMRDAVPREGEEPFG